MQVETEAIHRKARASCHLPGKGARVPYGSEENQDLKSICSLASRFCSQHTNELLEEVCRILLSGPLMEPWHVQLLRQAKLTPNKIAVTHHPGPGSSPNLTLGEFSEQAQRLANYLWKRGVLRNDNILMVVPSSYLGVLSMFAANICG